jgi:hypothetical protein
LTPPQGATAGWIVVDFNYHGEVDTVSEQLRVVIKGEQVDPLEEKKKLEVEL